MQATLLMEIQAATGTQCILLRWLTTHTGLTSIVGGMKTIKGFTYLPRQDSNNGNIKKYSIQVSNDGKTWAKAVAEGEFENNRKEKTILLTTPVKARFVRLTALSEQSGQDFATGAEFKVLEK